QLAEIVLPARFPAAAGSVTVGPVGNDRVIGFGIVVLVAIVVRNICDVGQLQEARFAAVGAEQIILGVGGQERRPDVFAGIAEIRAIGAGAGGDDGHAVTLQLHPVVFRAQDAGFHAKGVSGDKADDAPQVIGPAAL